MRISDDRLIRYVVRMMKSGVLSKGELRRTERGTPQGSLCSPILSNIFGHYAIDVWFKTKIVPRVGKSAFMVRYCDDMVIGCKKKDVAYIMRELKVRGL